MFAWEYVNIVVASRCFAFRAVIMQARISKRCGVQNSTSLLYLPISLSAETWKILTKKVCQFLFAQADILSEKNPYFRKHLFGKRKLITRATLFGQDFATGKNLFFNQCRTKSVVTMTPGWPCNKPDLTIKGTTLYSAPMTPGKHGPHKYPWSFARLQYPRTSVNTTSGRQYYRYITSVTFFLGKVIL